MLDVNLEEWQRVLAVNLTGPFLMTQAVAPIMRDQGGGAIVNITSISGLRASTFALPTAPARRAWRISPSSRRPSSASTASASMRWRRALSIPRWPRPSIRPPSAPTITTHIPLNRYGLEEELANAICFLCSDQASYITGQVLAVDGGFDAAGVGLPTLRKERREYMISRAPLGASNVGRQARGRRVASSKI